MLGPGNGFIGRDAFREWLLQAVAEQTRISQLVERAAREKNLSPVRFREALASVIGDSALIGARGGSAEPHGMDSPAIVLTSDGKIGVEQLHVDDMLGLRSLAVRR
jgi:hypothetical protein